MIHISVFPNFLLSPGPKGKAICALSCLLFPTLLLLSREGSAPEQIMAKTTPWWWSFPGSSTGKESTCNAGDTRSIPGSGRSLGEGIGYPLQYKPSGFGPQVILNYCMHIWVILSPVREYLSLFLEKILKGRHSLSLGPLVDGQEQVHWPVCPASNTLGLLPASVHFGTIHYSS